MIKSHLLTIISIISIYLTSAFNATPAEQELYCVVLSGGSGERLWPLSRHDKPKQFLSLVDEKSLLELTFDRLENIKAKKHYWTVTTANLAPKITSLMQNRIEHIVVEPARRNTAPAILLTCLEIFEKDPNGLVLFLPSDQHIPDQNALAQAINTILTIIIDPRHIILVGVKPTYPATGYGYIEFDQTQNGIVPVKAFHEKPCEVMAQEYFLSSTMVWNTCIFYGKASTFIEQYQRYAPEVYQKVIEFRQGADTYTNVPDISIDYAVLEKSSFVSVLPVNFDWSDIGNLSTFLSARSQTTKPDHGTICINCANNLVHTHKKLVALVDVEDLCIADTEDVLLIVPCQKAEHVKLALGQAKKEDAFKTYT